MIHLRRSLFITFFSTNAMTVVQFGVTLVLARLLTPAEVGIFSITSVVIGLAAVCIAYAVVSEPSAFGLAALGDPIPVGNRVELFIGTFVGAITFSGSVIAFGKLSGKYQFRLFKGAPVVYPGQHMINLLLAIAMLGFGIIFMLTQSWLPFVIMTLIAFALGVLIIIPIGGADMPVVVSMLNSYSGWAAAGIGFSLNNPMLIIAGSLVDRRVRFCRTSCAAR